MLMRGLMMDRPLLVTGLIQFAAANHSDTEIVTRSVEGPIHRTTYAETYVRIQKLANALISLGIKPGDRVATLANNTWRHFELYYAIAGIGAVSHTVNPRLGVEQLRYIINHAEGKLLFFDPIYADLVKELSGDIPHIQKKIVLTDAAYAAKHCNMPDVQVYDDLIAPQAEEFTWPEFDENTAASLCYTSGTTGNPKGVLYSHRALVLHSYGSGPATGTTINDTILPIVPMYHVNAWGYPYTAPMFGARLVFTAQHTDGANVFELMDNEGVTCSQAVPTVWMGLLNQMRKVGRKPQALERIYIGGAATPESMIDAFENEFGVAVHPMWGMTETTPLAVINTPKPKFKNLSPEERKKRHLRAGRLICGVEMRIVGVDGTILPNDGVTSGHVQVRGPWVLSSYYKAEKPTLTVDGWFDTSDIGTLDSDGSLQITDRAKDVIKSGGEWISSVDLENAAAGHPDIANAAVIGIAHPKWQERPLLICVAKGPKRPSLEELHAFLVQKIPKWWLPDAVEFVDVLPMGATGKIQKTALRERFHDYQLKG